VKEKQLKYIKIFRPFANSAIRVVDFVFENREYDWALTSKLTTAQLADLFVRSQLLELYTELLWNEIDNIYLFVYQMAFSEIAESGLLESFEYCGQWNGLELIEPAVSYWRKQLRKDNKSAK